MNVWFVEEKLKRRGVNSACRPDLFCTLYAVMAEPSFKVCGDDRDIFDNLLIA